MSLSDTIHGTELSIADRPDCLQQFFLASHQFIRIAR